MEIFFAIVLIVIGLAVGLLGYKLFRILLPIAGLVVGAVVGFTGIQGIFGTGVTSTTVAVLVAIVLAIVLGVLAYTFFDVALTVMMGLALSSLFVLFGVALGLSHDGFLVFLLSVTGFILGVVLATSSAFLAENLVTLVSGFVGAGFVLAGVFLLGGGVDLHGLHDRGIIVSVAERVSDSFIWALVWIAGAIVMRHVQLRTLALELFPSELAYHQSKGTK